MLLLLHHSINFGWSVHTSECVSLCDCNVMKPFSVYRDKCIEEFHRSLRLEFFCFVFYLTQATTQHISLTRGVYCTNEMLFGRSSLCRTALTRCNTSNDTLYFCLTRRVPYEQTKFVLCLHIHITHPNIIFKYYHIITRSICIFTFNFNRCV